MLRDVISEFPYFCIKRFHHGPDLHSIALLVNQIYNQKMNRFSFKLFFPIIHIQQKVYLFPSAGSAYKTKLLFIILMFQNLCRVFPRRNVTSITKHLFSIHLFLFYFQSTSGVKYIYWKVSSFINGFEFLIKTKN